VGIGQAGLQVRVWRGILLVVIAAPVDTRNGLAARVGQTVLCVSNLLFFSKKVFSDLSKNYTRKLHFDLEVYTS
jgi:hypothetical protein